MSAPPDLFMIQATTIQDPVLSGLDGIDHRFFTRRGGVSDGLYSSLNCGYGSGDNPDNVRENRRRAAGSFSVGETDLLTLHQIHSTDVLTVADARWTSPGAPKADGLVTDRPGVVLGVLAADCAPVLLADNGKGVIGACHAGWKGALGGVVEATIAGMEKLGARREAIRAVVGPCIGREFLRGRPRIPRAVPGAGCGPRRLLQAVTARWPFHLRSCGIFARARRACRSCRFGDAPRHADRHGGFLQLPAQHAAGRARLRSRPVGDRAAGLNVPYMVILVFVCMLGVVATCMML